MFALAGMTVDRVCSDFDGTDFEGWERVLILVAHKQETACEGMEK